MTGWFLAERHNAIKLSQRLSAAISRLETIQETNPEICLDEDLAYYKSVELVKPPKGWDEKRPLDESILGDLQRTSVKWQPIETAPKDGTVIICLDVKYREVEFGAWCEWEEDGFKEAAFLNIYNEEHELTPTHWAPAPEQLQEG